MSIDNKIMDLAFTIALENKKEVTPILLQLYELSFYYTPEYLKESYMRYKK